MPIIKNSTYRPKKCYRNSHIQTTFPTLFRRVKNVEYTRERIFTPDDDFIDLDYSKSINSKKIAVMCHGLEGSSNRAYIKGMIKTFHKRGIDSVAYNYRSCSEQMNKQLRMYNAGATDDLDIVIDNILAKKLYSEIYLIGFSLGGNLVLKYAGEKSSAISKKIKGIVSISAPCDLMSSAREIHKVKNIIYQKKFLKTLKEKIKIKQKSFSQLKNLEVDKIKTLKEFDDLVTAPIHGFENAKEYYTKSSSKPLLNKIVVPSYLLSAKDDPILGDECYPVDEAQKNKNLFLEMPVRGGHIGFFKFLKDEEYWHETRAVEFILDKCK